MAKEAEKSKEKTVSGAKTTAPEVPAGKADNCSEDCSSYELCEKEGNLSRFVPGMECTERHNLEDQTKPPEAKETPKRYVFPRQGNIKCPKCGLYETVATSTQGAIQSRKCTRAIPVCRHTFKITGTEVKITDCKQDS